MPPSPLLMSYEASKNRGPGAGAVDMSYDFVNVPVTSNVLVAFCDQQQFLSAEPYFEDWTALDV